MEFSNHTAQINSDLVGLHTVVSPARRLERSGGVGRETCVRAGSFRIHRAAVMVGMVVSSLLIPNHL